MGNKNLHLIIRIMEQWAFTPLVAFDGATGDFLKVKLRPGNVYISKGVVEFIQPFIEHYNEIFPETILFSPYMNCAKRNRLILLFS